ncbi:MAG TPA: alanine--tRNA ligase [Deltaproteobacteria bacterium]|nr:alanine--tRNA ligase [Deltaproteobacteria bacterium]
MKTHEIRRSFQDFFASKGHLVIPSAPLIPHNDPTLYFVNAGMVPFKDFFTGAEVPPGARATSSQKCLRVSGKHNDLDNVGRTPRHHTFFEMLGNFSFGDYFKADAIPYAWELLTEIWGIDAERLWVTIHTSDDEAFAIWHDAVGVPEARIQRLGDQDNFWSMGLVGPCGPCSEIHYDHGPGIDPAGGGPATESPRYVEIWNNVFMQLEQHEDGSRTALPRPSIDTGMGLERIAAVLQGVYSNYDTDAFQDLIARASALSGVAYGQAERSDVGLRVIADHARATTFLVSDGVMPSNDHRGYVLRRIMRRAITFGHQLGLTEPFLHQVCATVIEGFCDAYPELHERSSFIREVVYSEEERFYRTLERGMGLLERELADTGRTLSGQVAFKLYDTYGFPLDLTELIASERGIGIDEAGFAALMEEQKAKGRAAWRGSGELAVGELWRTIRAEQGDTRFTGYDQLRDTATVLALVRQPGEGEDQGSERVDRLEAGEQGVVILDRTPFYAESGGQAGDAGTLTGFEVHDTTKASGLHLHRGRATGTIMLGAPIEARVDPARRDRTRRNHTGTHLLHAALRTVLGDHVTQKGSLVGPDRLRFDFSSPRPVTPEELDQIERLVNEQILANKPLDTTLEDLEAAVAKGAMALFGEKYDDHVRVVTIPGFSVELCGGTHCTRTGDIGLLKIVSEGGIAAGVRRIEAQTGTGALAVIQQERGQLSGAARALKTEPARIVEAVTRLQEDRRALERRVGQLQAELAQAAAGDLLGQAREVGGVKILAATSEGDLKAQADQLRDQLGTSLVVLFSDSGGKVRLVAAVTRDIAGSRLHAGQALAEVAPLVGGRGGGRPDLAQGGGSDPAGIPAAVERVYAWAAEALG